MITPLTDEDSWLTALRPLPAWHPPHIPTLILAPHPDDETLGAGGLIHQLTSAGVPVTVIAVTDGELAYGITPGLAALRQHEQTQALAHLGVPSTHIHRLRLPDSSVATVEASLVAALAPYLHPGMHLVAPWQHDFHPDHEACGRAAQLLATRIPVQLTSYVFWTWHRGTPASFDGCLPVRLPLTDADLQAKQRALLCHQSQLVHPTGQPDQPILPKNLLAPAARPFEVYLPHAPVHQPDQPGLL